LKEPYSTWVPLVWLRLPCSLLISLALLAILAFLPAADAAGELIRVIEAYWVPAGYPGSEDVTLRLVLENEGSKGIVGGSIEVTVPNVTLGDALRASLPAIAPGTTVTVDFNGVNINPNASIGLHQAVFNATLRFEGEEGGVEVNGAFNISVASPPTGQLKLVDYGISPIALATPGAGGVNLYFKFRVNMPGTRINHVYARLHLDNTVFANGLKDAFVYLRGPYAYGDVITLTSPPLVELPGRVNVSLKLELLGSDRGAEYWAETATTLLVKAERSQARLVPLAASWEGGRAYPGSEGLTLNIKLWNAEPIEASSITARLLLPRGFYPATLSASAGPIPSGSQFNLRFTGIDLDRGLEPGLYNATLILNATFSEGQSSYTRLVVMPVTIAVNTPSRGVLQVLYKGFSVGQGYREMLGAKLRVTLRVAEPVTVKSIYASIPAHSPCIIMRSPPYRSLTGDYGYGSIITIEFDDIDVHCSLGDAWLVVNISALVSDNGAEYWINDTLPVRVNLTDPTGDLRIVEAGVEALPGMEARAVKPYAIILFSSGAGSLEWVIVNATIKGASFSDGARSHIYSFHPQLTPGGMYRIELGSMDIYSWQDAWLTLRVSGVVSLADGSRYIVHVNYTRRLTLPREEKALEFMRMDTYYNNQPAPLYPGQWDVELRVLFRNNMPYRISSATPRVYPSTSGINVLAAQGTCLSGVAPGAVCTLNLRLSIDSGLKPGIYAIVLRLDYSYVVEGSLYNGREYYTLLAVIHDPLSDAPRPEIVAAYWGETPQRVYAWNAVTRLTIVIVNRGRHDARGVEVSIIPLNSTVDVVAGSSICAQNLQPGGACTASLYVSLEEAKPGTLVFNTTITYQWIGRGLNMILKKHSLVSLKTTSPPRSPGLRLVSAGWLNNWPVYPGSENATLQVTLTNQWPYPVTGVWLSLFLPEGFTPRIAKAYVPGPIQPYDVFTVTYTISVKRDVSPGAYEANLSLSYVLATSSPTITWNNTLPLKLTVSDPGKAFRLVAVEWLGGAPSNYTASSALRLVFRNENAPLARGLTLEIELPQGILCSISGVRRAVVTLEEIGREHQAMPWPSYPTQPYTPTPSTLIPEGGLSGGDLAQRLAYYGGVGGLYEATIPLSVYSINGLLEANATLQFIDAWGSLVKEDFHISLPIPSTPRMLSVSLKPEVLSIINGTATVRLELRNLGGGDAIDVNVYLVPASPLLIPSTSKIHVDKLNPGEKVEENIVLVYNPAATSMFGSGGGVEKPAAVPLTIALTYYDVLGRLHSQNTTVPLMLKPMIDVEFSDKPRATYKSGRLTVGGRVVNKGLAAARNLEVVVEVDGVKRASFLGDLEPSSQAAFRIDMEVASIPDSVITKLVYLDDYGNAWAKTYVVKVEVVRGNATATVRAETHTIPVKTTLPVMAMVAVFLTASFIAIYRHVRKSMGA